MIRNQLSTIQKIQMISTLTITTYDEAIAFLRSISGINLQVADIIQRHSLQVQHSKQAPVKQPAPVKVEEVQEVKEMAQAITFDEETFTDDEKNRMADKIKSIKKKK